MPYVMWCVLIFSVVSQSAFGQAKNHQTDSSIAWRTGQVNGLLKAFSNDHGLTVHRRNLQRQSRYQTFAA